MKESGKAFVNKTLFDGIQVSINSDKEEELDYEDDVAGQEMESGSIDQDHEESVSQSSPEKDLDLGATSSSLTEEHMIMNNPHLRKLLNKMLDKKDTECEKRRRIQSV